MSFLKKVGKGVANSLGGGIVGLGTSLIGNLFGNKSRRKEADRAFNRSKAMFDYTNQYNTPARQMERLKAAGLNPALMYGQGNTGNASNPPQQQAAEQKNPLDLNSMLLYAQIRNIDADTDSKNASIALTTEKVNTELATQLNIDAQRAKTIQEALNLKTQDQINQLVSSIKQVEKDRATNKGIVKGDTIGNMLSVLNLDPQNNPNDRTLLQTVITAYFGAKIARDILSGIGMAKGKSIQTTIGKIGKQVKNYGRN